MMMRGYVNQNYEAMLSLVVRNGDKLKSITAVIDTGFTGIKTEAKNLTNTIQNYL